MKEIDTKGACLLRAEAVGVKIIRSIRYDKHTSREILCNQCNRVTEIQDQTLRRWADKGNKFCGICNGALKNVPYDVKVDQLNAKRPKMYIRLIEVVEYLGYNPDTTQAYCIVKFIKCQHTKKYSTTTLGGLFKHGKGFKCDICNSNTSCIEQLVSDNNYLDKSFEPQVPYACFIPTTRRWVADFYSEKLNTVLEVTSGGLKTRGDYSENLEDKRQVCIDNGIRFFAIKSINDIEDIVQTLSDLS